jgi:outer membrane lipoprotein-sorting protein
MYKVLVFPRFVGVLFLSCLLTFSTTEGWAGSTALEKIQALYSNLSSLRFDFQQISRSSGRSRQGSGNSIFYRISPEQPGIIRWNYTTPEVQIILNDGKQLFIYTQKDKQVIITAAEDMQNDITYAFFTKNRKITEDFTVHPADSRFLGDSHLQALQLIPQQAHGQVKAVHLWFDSQYIIHKMIMEDHFETLTELFFTKIEFNTLPMGSTHTEEALLRLDLPPGTEVIRQ